VTSLVLLAACALTPWLVCGALKNWVAVGSSSPPSMRERALRRYHRATLFVAIVALPASAIAGALAVDPALSTRWPIAGSWFFASLSALSTWTSLALARRTPEEVAAMPGLETVGRAVQILAVPILATGLSLLAHVGVEALTPFGPLGRAVAAAVLSVLAVIVVSPWLAMKLRLWPVFPRRIGADGLTWRLAHLPAPTPFLTHAAALPWLRTALVSDGLFAGIPERAWQTLVRYEISGASSARGQRSFRWLLALSLSLLAFLAAGAIGASDPRMLVAASISAVFFTAAAGWLANREPASKLGLDADGPSMRELAQCLRSLPSGLGQALPRTSHRSLGPALYDRLYALGHDPGRRPQR